MGYIQAPQALYNKGQRITFYHLISARAVSFPAFVTSFNETFNCEWNSENIYGRTDAVYTYKNTARSITMGLKIPAATTREGFNNLEKLQQLLQFLYPKYKTVGPGVHGIMYQTTAGGHSPARTVTQSPLVRMRVMNLIQNRAAQNAPSVSDYFNTGEAVVPTDGLLGYITNVSIAHNLETNEGVLEGGNASAGTGEVIPKVIEVTLDFKALHEHHLGWEHGTRTGEDSAEGLSIFNKGDVFPYGADFDEGGPQVTEREAQAAEARAAADTAREADHIAAADEALARADLAFDMAEYSTVAAFLANPNSPLDLGLIGFGATDVATGGFTIGATTVLDSPTVFLGPTGELASLTYDNPLQWSTLGTTPTATQASSDEAAAVEIGALYIGSE